MKSKYLCCLATFVAKTGMVKPEIMLCEKVLNLSTLRYVTAQYPVT